MGPGDRNMITSSNTMALNNHYATALGPRLGLGLRLDFGSQVWFVQYFSENLVVVLYEGPCFPGPFFLHFHHCVWRSRVLAMVIYLLIFVYAVG